MASFRSLFAGLAAGACLGCAPQLPPAQRFLAAQVTDMPPIVVKSATDTADDPFANPDAAFLALTLEIGGVADGAMRVVRADVPKKPPVLQCPGPFCLQVPVGVPVQARVELWSKGETGLPLAPLARGRTLPFVGGNRDDDAKAQAYVVKCGGFSLATANDGSAATFAGRIGVGAALMRDPADGVILAGGAQLKPDATDAFDPQNWTQVSASISKYNILQRRVEQLANVLGQPRAFPAVAAGATLMAVAGGYAQKDGKIVPSAAVDFIERNGTVHPAKFTLKHARGGATIVSIHPGEDFFLLLAGEPDGPCPGECGANSWEIIHPKFGVVASGGLLSPRWHHASVLLPGPKGGYVMLVGGENSASVVGTIEFVQWSISAKGLVTVSRAGDKCGADAKAAECADIPGFFWTPQQIPLPSPRTWPGAGYVRSLNAAGGTAHFVAVFGGFADATHSQALGDLHVFEYASMKFRPDPLGLSAGRAAPLHAVVDGGLYGQQLLVAGGAAAVDHASATAAVFLAQPDAAKPDAMLAKTAATANALLDGDRMLGTAVALPTGHALIVGGVGGAPGNLQPRTKVLLWGAL